MKNKKIFRLLETNNGHWYYIKNKDFPNGVDLPSVTNILEYYPNKGLNYWLETTSPEEIENKKESGTKQGSKTHHCCFLLSVGEIIDPDKGLTKEQIIKLPIETSEDKKKDMVLINYLQESLTEREHRALIGFQNYWEEFKPITVDRELEVYHKILRYAGTLDWCGYLWNKKLNKYEFWVIDYKISKQHSKSYEAQIIAYYKALCKIYGNTFKSRLGILYIGKTTKKKFQLKEVEDKKEAWDMFINSKKFWHADNKGATPKTIEKRESIAINISFKRKGRMKHFNK